MVVPRIGWSQETHRHGSLAPIGPEFRVNTFTAGNQGLSSAAFHPSGFIAVWESDGQDGSGKGVYGRSANGAEFRVNTFVTGDQQDPDVASNGSGAFVVVWTSPQDGSGNGVFAQRFASSGAPVGAEFQVNTFTTGTQYQPAVAADAAGNFVVVWNSVDQEGTGAEVFGQRFSSAGVPLGTEFRVNTFTAGDQHLPDIGSDSAGNFLVVWQDGPHPPAPGRGIFGRSYDSTGAAVGPEFQVNTRATGFEGAPAVAVNPAGGTVVVWHAQDGSDLGIFGQRYSVSGARIDSEFQVNTFTAGRQADPAVAMEESDFGCFVVAWSSDGQDGSGSGVYARVYPFGVNPADVALVNEFTTGSQTRAAVAAIPDVDLVVLWDSEGQDGSGSAVYGRVDNHFVPVELMRFTVE
ncbi:MAG: hypothetical protein ABW221_06045 [Vicinamibacteria bacterium]